MVQRRVLYAGLVSMVCALQAPPLQSRIVAGTTASRRTSLRPLFSEVEDQRSTGVIAAGGFNTAGEPPITIRGFSLAKAFLGAGTLITLSSFAEFFSSSGANGLSSLGFIYGIPILLIGCSLQYAELEPVPVEFNGDEEKLEVLFEAQGTETMKQIREDVTRHRYGDEAHLDTTVKALGLVPPGKDYPQLKYLQFAGDDQLSFTMVFQSMDTPYNDWADEKRVRKYKSFFGPGVESASVIKVNAEERLVAIQLIVEKKEDSPVPATAI